MRWPHPPSRKIDVTSDAGPTFGPDFDGLATDRSEVVVEQIRDAQAGVGRDTDSLLPELQLEGLGHRQDAAKRFLTSDTGGFDQAALG